MTAESLAPLPVAIPLVAAGLALILLRRPNAQRLVSVGSLTVVLIIEAILLRTVALDGPVVVAVGGWAAPVGIAIVIDHLSALMLLVSSVVVLGVLLYSLAQGIADRGTGAPVAIYHPTFLVLVAGVSNAFCSGDLFNIYVGFEMLLVASFVLLTLGGTRERIRAGTIYVVVSLLSSVIFLTAIGLVYSATGTVNLAQLAQRLPEIDAGLRLTLQAMLLLAFAIKAAVFPLSAWLPDSYPTAPAPVTAVFAGLLTKVGIYALIRTQTLLFPGGRLDDWLMWAALATMLLGILGAVAQDDVKRMLSFTLVSHIGFLVFGIALAGRAGLTAAIFYVAHHITVQTALFLVVGLIERRAGSTSLRRLGSLAHGAPLLAALFFVPAMSLAGIPPLSGFLGKVGLIQAGVADGTPLAFALVAGSLVTSILTLYAVVKAWNRAFWRPPSQPLPVGDTPWGMVAPTAALVAAGLALTVAAGPLYRFSDRAAEYLLAREPYIAAALPDGRRGSGPSPDAVEGAGEGATEGAGDSSATGAAAAPSPEPGREDGR